MLLRTVWFFLSLFAAFTYSFVWLLVRATKGLPSSVVTTIQFIVGPILLFFSIGSVTFPWSEPVWYWYLLSSCIIPPLSVALNYCSQRTDVTLIKPLSGLSSISATLLPIFLFHTSFPLTGLLGVAIGTIGFFILYHARWDSWKKPYPWIVLITMLVFGINAAIVGMTLAVFPHPFILCFVSHALICLFSLGSSVRHWKGISWNIRYIGVLAALATVTILQEFATNAALTMAPAGYMISVKRTSIIFASLGGYFFFQERSIPLRRLLTATIIVVAGVALLLV